MRSLKFRDVLWAVAYKSGQDPLQGDFLTNQAIPIGHSISQWVRRLWDAQDWPEWTIIRALSPNPSTHIVPYDQAAGGPDSTMIAYKMGKVLKVYLVDPSSTSAPVETDFELTPSGVHCGFEHGASVWIKFVPVAPKFTAEVWKADQTYDKDEPTYLDLTGECYRSAFNGNRNHQPAPFTSEGTLHALPPISDVTREAASGQPGTPVLPLILEITHQVQEAFWEAGTSYIDVYDIDSNLLGSANYIHVAGDDAISIITALKNQLSSAIGLATFTITLDTGALTITLEDNSQFTVYGRALWQKPNGQVVLDKVRQVQAYNPGLSASVPTTQRTEFAFTNDQVTEGATHTVTIFDQLGGMHTFSYTVQENDSIESILDGLAASMAAASSLDAYFEKVSVVIDNDSQKLAVETPPSSVEVISQLVGQPYWILEPFPLALADAVIRGATGDLEKEWGQTQEGMADEQAVGSEAGIAAARFMKTDAPMTEQQEKRSRYKVG